MEHPKKRIKILKFYKRIVYFGVRNGMIKKADTAHHLACFGNLVSEIWNFMLFIFKMINGHRK